MASPLRVAYRFDRVEVLELGRVPHHFKAKGGLISGYQLMRFQVRI